MTNRSFMLRKNVINTCRIRIEQRITLTTTTQGSTTTISVNKWILNKFFVVLFSFSYCCLLSFCWTNFLIKVQSFVRVCILVRVRVKRKRLHFCCGFLKRNFFSFYICHKHSYISMRHGFNRVTLSHRSIAKLVKKTLL